MSACFSLPFICCELCQVSGDKDLLERLTGFADQLVDGGDYSILYYTIQCGNKPTIPGLGLGNNSIYRIHCNIIPSQ